MNQNGNHKHYPTWHEILEPVWGDATEEERKELLLHMTQEAVGRATRMNSALYPMVKSDELIQALRDTLSALRDQKERMSK